LWCRSVSVPKCPAPMEAANTINLIVVVRMMEKKRKEEGRRRERGRRRNPWNVISGRSLRYTADMKAKDCCVIICGQGYAQQLQDNERRLAELMRVERKLRHHHGGSTQQPDSDNEQGNIPYYYYILSWSLFRVSQLRCATNTQQWPVVDFRHFCRFGRYKMCQCQNIAICTITTHTNNVPSPL